MPRRSGRTRRTNRTTNRKNLRKVMKRRRNTNRKVRRNTMKRRNNKYTKRKNTRRNFRWGGSTPAPAATDASAPAPAPAESAAEPDSKPAADATDASAPAPARAQAEAERVAEERRTVHDLEERFYGEWYRGLRADHKKIANAKHLKTLTLDRSRMTPTESARYDEIFLKRDPAHQEISTKRRFWNGLTGKR
jgi:hypothetical protein